MYACMYVYIFVLCDLRVLMGLYTLNPNLSFQKTKVTGALRMVYQANKDLPSFRFSKAELADWVETL